MELAKLTSKGQITIPKEIRLRLRLKEGDKIFFVEENGQMVIQNASQAALRDFQKKMEGQAQKAGFTNEKDIVEYIKRLRAGSDDSE